MKNIMLYGIIRLIDLICTSILEYLEKNKLILPVISLLRHLYEMSKADKKKRKKQQCGQTGDYRS